MHKNALNNEKLFAQSCFDFLYATLRTGTPFNFSKKRTWRSLKPVFSCGAAAAATTEHQMFQTGVNRCFQLEKCECSGCLNEEDEEQDNHVEEEKNLKTKKNTIERYR